MKATEEEKAQLRTIFIPLTAAEIIWDYVDKVLRYCADNRISQTIKLSRAVKTMHAAYEDEISRSLDRACDEFKQRFSYDLTVMFCTIANELNHKYVGHGVSHEEMRVNALGSIMLLRALRTVPGVVSLPRLKHLDEIMDAYVAPYELDLSANVDNCQKILARRLAEVPEIEVNI